MSKATESWADWILSSYSESISPPPAETLPSPSLESDSSDVSHDTYPPRSPYAKTGRGGAGNFTWQSEFPHDVEAQHQPSLRSRQASATNSEAADRAEKMACKTRPGNIVTGRGGVGNVVPAAYAPATPRSPKWPLSPNSPAPPTTPRTASAVYGRGGAGNFTASSLALSQAKDEKVDEERRIAEDLREKAEHDVENMLKPPEGAFLAGARRRESGVAV